MKSELLLGMKIVVAPEFPKYQLPLDLPLPEDFRADFNKWAREFFGMTCMVPPGTMYMVSTPYEQMLIHPQDYAKVVRYLDGQ